MSQAIKHAIQAEYISANGRLTIDTQTAYALALAFELLPENQLERVARDLVTRLGKMTIISKQDSSEPLYQPNALSAWIP